MITVLMTFCAFIGMVLLVVTIHELGHFIVARHYGVRVLRFSIGFGRPLFEWRGRQGTIYTLAMIPLGGYVKMLDARVAPVPPILTPYTYDGQSVWRRMAILVAGPLANFLLAICLYWIVLVIGIQVRIPVIESILPYSPASYVDLRVGDELVQVDGHPTPSWEACMVALSSHVGDADALIVTIKRDGVSQDFAIQHTPWPKEIAPEMLLDAIGIGLIEQQAPAQIGVVQAESPAAIAGLQPQDRVLQVNAQPVTWATFVEMVRNSPSQPLILSIARHHHHQDITVVPMAISDSNGQLQGRLGVGIDTTVLSKDHWRRMHYGPVKALQSALQRTGWYSWLTLEMIGKMIVGEASLDNLSGPVMMAQGAGETVRAGFVHYLSFLALVSISLGVLNLLPIPMLDGGNLLYCALEALRGRPLPLPLQEWGVRVGAAVLFTLLGIALYNDLLRAFAGV